MKNTLLITLISGAIFSVANGATNTTVQNDSNSVVQGTLKRTGTNTYVDFTVNPGQRTGSISSPEDSTLTFKTATGTVTLSNPQARLIRITPEGGINFEN